MLARMETKIDPEAELSNAQRMFQKLAPLCSVEKRSGGIPQLAPQEKQLAILHHELNETNLCINLAKKGRTAVRDFEIRNGIERSIKEYEQMEHVLRDERAQQMELDCLNYLTQKHITEMFKTIPTEEEELSMIENAHKRLRRMENRLDLATKRYCIVNTDNRQLREEIDRLVAERESFNLQWNHTISKLVKGKMFLMDILEIALLAFSDRDEWCRKLDALKWKGVFQLNRDIAEMHAYESELNHLAKLEEFLRVKGTQRMCEADEKEETKRLEEIQACEQKIAQYDALLEEIFGYTDLESVGDIIRRFRCTEIENFSCFLLLCEVLQETIFLRKDINDIRLKIMDQRDKNEAREEQQAQKISGLLNQLTDLRTRTDNKRVLKNAANVTKMNMYKGIEDLWKLAQCDYSSLLPLLGNHKEVTKFNYNKFLKILEAEVKNLIYVAYGIVKPPAPTPITTRQGKVQARQAPPVTKTVADPKVKILKPNKIDKLVPYQPCAYCVEDYIMNLVFETPAVLATKEYVNYMFHLDNPNTRFGIYTLTIPSKRHPFREKWKD